MSTYVRIVDFVTDETLLVLPMDFLPREREHLKGLPGGERYVIAVEYHVKPDGTGYGKKLFPHILVSTPIDA